MAALALKATCGSDHTYSCAVVFSLSTTRVHSRDADAKPACVSLWLLDFERKDMVRASFERGSGQWHEGVGGAAIHRTVTKMRLVELSRPLSS